MKIGRKMLEFHAQEKMDVLPQITHALRHRTRTVTSAPRLAISVFSSLAAPSDAV